jgi:hypothetical protein
MGSLFSSDKGGSNAKKSSSTANAKKSNTNNGKTPPQGQAQVTSKDRAILDLKNAKDRLKKFKKKVKPLSKLVSK